VYRLRSGGGLGLLVIGRSKYARGADVIQAIELLSQGGEDDPDLSCEAMSEAAGLAEEKATEQSAELAAWSIA
jgi:hypothetical protein